MDCEGFWLEARRDEGAYPHGSATEEQRSIGQKTRKTLLGYL
ncbi:MAG TPA: hypothetical protein VEH27_03520 [Methylomirabilota bacterium]|nr:hypothetical protein [Methylomirabilota bacterium]